MTDEEDYIERLQPDYREPESKASFAAPADSEATWRRLAIQIAEQAEVVLQNAHWDVSYGSGDMRNTIKAVRRMQHTGSEIPPKHQEQKQV